ncbi:MAG: condensation domain-containing protein, partial [Escherichia sp.]
MAFSNPFDDPQGAFYIFAMRSEPFSLWRNNAPYRQAGTLWSAAVTGVLPAVAGSPLAYSDTGEFHPVAGGTMSQHLPLVAAQPGIWMAEKLSDLPSAWSVAHYVELTGEVDAPLLARAVVAGLAQADTLRMRFTEDNGEVWQWVDDAQTFELPEIIDLRTNIDPHGTARALMQADLQQDLRVDSGK